MITTITDPAFATGPTLAVQSLPQHIRPTAAKSYLGCSLQFYFERVAGIRKKTPVALHLGKAVHAALQVFHLARWRAGDNSPESIATAFEASFNDLERDEGPVKFKDPKERDKTRLDGLRIVAAYLDSPEAMKEKPRAVEVMLTENMLYLEPGDGSVFAAGGRRSGRTAVSNPSGVRGCLILARRPIFRIISEMQRLANEQGSAFRRFQICCPY